MSAQKNIMRSKSSYEKREPKEYDEKVIEIARVSRVAKGGRRIRFRALVVIGNHNGKIGMGIAKATEVAEAVKKAVSQAKKRITLVPIINGTIPYEITQKHGGARVMLRPATPGTSIVAGGSVRSVAEIVGITDLLAKSLGSSNKVNNVTATIKALSSFNPDIVAKIKNFKDKSDAKEIKSLEEKGVLEKKIAEEPKVDEEKKTPEEVKVEKTIKKASKNKVEK